MTGFESLSFEMMALIAAESNSNDLIHLSQAGKGVRYVVLPHLYKRIYKTLTIPVGLEETSANWRSHALIHTVLKKPEILTYIKKFAVKTLAQDHMAKTGTDADAVLDVQDWELLSQQLQKTPIKQYKKWLTSIKRFRLLSILAYLVSQMGTAGHAAVRNSPEFPRLFWKSTVKYPILFTLARRYFPLQQIQELFLHAGSDQELCMVERSDWNTLRLSHHGDGIDWLKLFMAFSRKLGSIDYTFNSNNNTEAGLDGAKLRKVLDVKRDSPFMVTITIGDPLIHPIGHGTIRVQSPLGSFQGFNKLQDLTMSASVMCGWGESDSLELVDVVPTSLTAFDLLEEPMDALSSWDRKTSQRKLTHFLENWKSSTPQLRHFVVRSKNFTNLYRASVNDLLRDMVLDGGVTVIFAERGKAKELILL